MRKIFLKSILSTFLCVSGLVVAVSWGVLAQTKVVPATRGDTTLSFAPLVKTAAPAVVNIYTRRVIRARDETPLFSDPFFRRFFGDKFRFGGKAQKRVQNSLGSGVIVTDDGLIVTNYHVIEKADEITVVLSDRREYDADVVIRDERTDLAILRIKIGAERLPFLRLKDSDTLEVGDLVLAIGNPFGVGQTVTSGIVSALARTAQGVSDFGFFIQTDAAINPGNSGGALVSLDGGLVGINTAIYSRGGGSNGIGFAIPTNMVATVIGGAMKGGTIVRPWIGATGQTVDADIARSIGLTKPAGVLVNSVHPRGPAAAAGLKVGDVIISIGGKGVPDANSLRFRIATLSVGRETLIGGLRNGKAFERRIFLIAAPEDPPRNLSLITGNNPYAGSEVANLSPAVAEELSLDSEATGVIVIRLKRGSPADRIGLEPGDILMRLNGREIGSVKTLKNFLMQDYSTWQMEINRSGRLLQIRIGS
ncbi:MAG: Do family serine endopeptidase [Pseudomonadota bacterium]|nr:Do family serine endopeptidase [Pseudomonadota bacterium]